MNVTRQAGRVLESLLAQVGPVEMGFRVQGLAAHMLLALGYRISEVNSSGHPDVVAQGTRGVVRVEVEADTRGIGVHLPKPEDLTALSPQTPGDRGYFAIAVCSPLPIWIVVESYKLVDRRFKLALPLLEALSDQVESETWSGLFEELVVQYGSRLGDFSFQWLARQALQQTCLINRL
jgi:hypothetical protein